MAVAKKENPVFAILASAEKKHNIIAGTMNSVAEGTIFLSSGNIAIDYALGGGLPMRRSVELFGPPSSGKTTTALQYAAGVQSIIKAGGNEALGITADDFIVYLDYEQAMDPEYAKSLGLDTEDGSFIFAQPDTLEEGAEFLKELLATDRIRVIIVDSVAAMTPSAKAEAEIGKSLPAVQAKLMKDFGVQLNGLLKHHNATAIFINHEMEKMDMGARRPGMPAPTTTPGGVAMKFFASQRVRYQQIKQNKSKVMDPITQTEVEIPTSTDVKVTVVKNKVAPPYRTAIVRVRYGRGFDNFWTALQILLANKKIMHQAGMFYFHNLADAGFAPMWMPRQSTGTNRPYIKGADKLMSIADQYPDWRTGLIQAAEELVRDNADALKLVVPTSDEESDEEDLGELEAASPGNRVSIS